MRAAVLAGTVTLVAAARDCTQLFTSTPVAPQAWPPPRKMPPELAERYTMNGTAAALGLYMQEKQSSEQQRWNLAHIARIMRDCKHQATQRLNTNSTDPETRAHACSCYGTDVCLEALAFYRAAVQGGHALVIGSQHPWAEAMLIEVGASHVTTIEWANTTLSNLADQSDEAVSFQQRWAWAHPTTVASDYLSDSWPPADVAFTYSSLEHDGLGRYGDPLNPDGDLESLHKIWCLLKPGGLLFFGVPVGGDAVVWNAHRVYGSARIARVLERGWRLLTFFGTADAWDRTAESDHPLGFGLGAPTYQPMFVLQKAQSSA